MTKPLPARSVNLQHLDPKVTARALGGSVTIVAPAAPGTPVIGDLWINSGSSNQLAQWTGAEWQPVQINAGVLTGSDFIINNSGLFFYNPAVPLTHWDFESGTESWTAAGATLAQSPQQAHSGSSSGLLTYTSGTSWSATGPKAAVAAGTVVYAAAWAYAAQNLGAVGLQIAWYNSGGTLLSTSSATTAALTSGSWTQFAYSATAPASTAFASLIVQDNEASTTGYQLFIDDAYIAGALLVSAAASALTDPLGNVIPSGGVTAYGGNGTSATAASLYNASSAAALVLAFIGAAHSTLNASAYGVLQNPGAANEGQLLILTSGKSGGDDAALQLYGEPANASSAAVAILEFGGTVAVQVTKTVAAFTVPVARTLAGFAGYPALTQASETSVTANTTGYTNLSVAFTVPANDAQGPTVYRLKAWGSGQQATGTAQVVGFRISGFGNATATVVVAASVVAAADSYSWSAVAEIIVLSAGTSVQAMYSLAGQMTDNGSHPSGTNSVPFTANSGYVNVNTTVSQTMVIQAAIGSATGAPSVTSFCSTFERVGP